MTSGSPYEAAALAMHRAGLSVLPPREDGSKAPIDLWKRYQRERADVATIRAWYANGRTGVGAVMGAVSQHTTLFEFERYEIYQAYKRAAEAAGIGATVDRIERGYAERTPGGGVHWYYRTDRARGSTRLAKRPKAPDEMRHAGDRWAVLIETKGEGGYAVMAPSAGTVHPTGRAYEVLSGSVAGIVAITDEEEAQLWTLARTFDETPPETDGERLREWSGNRGSGGRPGDLFAQRASWREILVPHGWRAVYSHGDVTAWRRPGKDRGISATTNYRGSDLLYVFSTSTAFEAERGYGKFSAYAVLNHGGDFQQAARTLADEGYQGEPAEAVWEDDEPAASFTVDEETGEVRFGPYEIIDGPDFLNRPPQRWRVQGVIPDNGFALVLGEPGSYKTFFGLELGLCIATGLPFYGRAVKQGNVLYVAAEGAGGLAARLRAWALHRDTAIPRAFKVLPGVVPLTTLRRVQALIRQIAAQFPGEEWGAAFLDTWNRNLAGGDENSSVDVGTAVQSADALRVAIQAPVITLHHGRKSDGSPRGHSSLPGALDTIISLERHGQHPEPIIVNARFTKQKDGTEGRLIDLKPVIVELDTAAPDEADEDEILLIASTSSVVLEPLEPEEQSTADAARREKRERRVSRLSRHQRAAALALYEAFNLGGATPDEWQQAWRDRNPAVAHQRFTEAAYNLASRGLVRMEGEAGAERYFVTARLAEVLRSLNTK
jgi:hypothetical protein